MNPPRQTKQEVPNWTQVVRKRLSDGGLQIAEHEEIVAELAAHLEEAYDHARATGLSPQSAFERSLAEVTNWRALAREIHKAKSEEGLMNYRTKTLWLPALATFLGTSVSLWLCQYSGIAPRIVWIRHNAVWFYWPWLITLPIFGAVGAYLSQRARGATTSRIAAGLSPALIMLAVMSLVLPFGIAIDGFHFFQLVSFGLMVINWVALPALALMLGELPFLQRKRHQSV
jgi:hypothetical protein